MAKSIPAIFGVNRYLWKQVKDNLILNESDYDGLTPIVPVQESPEFIQAMESGEGIGQHPFIVYTWYTNGIDSSSWYKQTDNIIYTIYSTDQKKLRQLIMLITSLLKRYDLSAASVNDFTADLGGEYASYHYKSIWVAAVDSGNPSGYENEPIAATVTVRVQYTDEDNDLPLP